MTDPRGEFNLANGRFEREEMSKEPQTSQEPTRAQVIQAFETIRLKLIDCLDEPERSAFWLAVQMRDALSRPYCTATENIDGGQ
jgi:hypothetical protein